MLTLLQLGLTTLRRGSIHNKHAKVVCLYCPGVGQRFVVLVAVNVFTILSKKPQQQVSYQKLTAVFWP